MEKLVWCCGNVGACLLMVACAGVSDEPSLPSSAPPEDGRIVRVPTQSDGTLDTAGMARMRFGESRHAFGRVEAGAIVEHRFPFRNVGATPLTITGASSTCGCTVPSWPRAPIAPGDTASIYVRFDTEGKAGPQTKVVTLTANTFPNATQVSLVGVVDAKQ